MKCGFCGHPSEHLVVSCQVGICQACVVNAVSEFAKARATRLDITHASNHRGGKGEFHVMGGLSTIPF